MDYVQLFNRLVALVKGKTSISESWGYLEISGESKSSIVKEIIDTVEYFKTFGRANAISIMFDGDHEIQLDDLNDYLAPEAAIKKWKIHINKIPLIGKDQLSDYTCNFFFQESKLENWIEMLNPFDPKNPFIEYSPIRIIVKDLQKPILGPCIQIIPFDYQSEASKDVHSEFSLPAMNRISEVVRILSKKEIFISPSSYVVYSEAEGRSLKAKLLKFSILSLAATIVNEFHSEELVKLDGLRLINIKLFESNDDFNETLNKNLVKLVEWIYGEKDATTVKLGII